MSYIGDFKLGSTFNTKFTTIQVSGAPTTLSGVPVISAYLNNNTTELTAGITLTVDFDTRTGMNNIQVVATSGNGYATATDYQLVITTGTVNSVSVVGYVVAEFSIENRRADVQFWNGTQVATPATAGIPDVNVKNMNNVAGTSITTVKAVQGLATADTVVTVSGNVNGSVGSVTGAVGSVTGAVGSVTGAVGSVTGNVGGNVVGSVASVTAAVGITSNIKTNQALAKYQFLMTDSTNHNPATGLVVTVTRSIDAAAFAAGTLSAVTEIASGMYSIDFGAGDLNGKVIILRCTAAASDTTFERIVTQP